jgi:hypothetical protein
MQMKLLIDEISPEVLAISLMGLLTRLLVVLFVAKAAAIGPF